MPAGWWIVWYRWLSRDEVLAQYTSHGDSGVNTVRFNVVTRTFERADLGADLADLTGFWAGTPSVSPDCKWFTRSVGNSQRETQRVDGSRQFVFPLCGLDAVWSRDSRSFAERDVRREIFSFSERDNADHLMTTRLKITGLPNPMSAAPVLSHECKLAGDWSIVYVSSPDRIVVSGFKAGQRVARTVDVRQGVPVGSDYALPVPDVASVTQGDVSPNSRWIAWFVECRHERLTWLGGPNLTFTTASEIWISGVRGTDFRRIGSIPHELGTNPRPHLDVIRDGQWVPGSNAVSYLWHGRIWTVAVQ